MLWGNFKQPTTMHLEFQNRGGRKNILKIMAEHFFKFKRKIH